MQRITNEVINDLLKDGYREISFIRRYDGAIRIFATHPNWRNFGVSFIGWVDNDRNCGSSYEIPF